jgi:hypothetical protein
MDRASCDVPISHAVENRAAVRDIWMKGSRMKDDIPECPPLEPNAEVVLVDLPTFITLAKP